MGCLRKTMIFGGALQSLGLFPWPKDYLSMQDFVPPRLMLNGESGDYGL